MRGVNRAYNTQCIQRRVLLKRQIPTRGNRRCKRMHNSCGAACKGRRASLFPYRLKRPFFLVVPDFSAHLCIYKSMYACTAVCSFINYHAPSRARCSANTRVNRASALSVADKTSRPAVPRSIVSSYCALCGVHADARARLRQWLAAVSRGTWG